jgi:hypothetical protein
MGNLFDKGSALVASAMRAALSADVVYIRGSESVRIPATVGRTVFEVEDSQGVLRWESRDFVVSACDLVLGALPVVPVKGDLIEERSCDGTVRTYEVTAPGREQEWKYADTSRRMIRVHTKLRTQTA